MTGALFRSTFNDINGVEHIVEIHQRGVSAGSTTNIKLLDSGYTIERQGKGDKLFENPIRAARATATYVIDNSSDYGYFTSSFPTAPEETFDMLIYKNGNLNFVGTLLSDQFNYDRESLEGKVLVTVAAVDGLSRLENFDLSFATGSTFRKTAIELIIDILDTNGLSAYFGGSDAYLYDGLVWQNASKSTSRGLEYIQFNQLMFRHGNPFVVIEDVEPYNCKQALEKILTTINARIHMTNGSYRIIQPLQQKQTSYDYLAYTKTGGYISTTTVTNALTVYDGSQQVKSVFLANPVLGYQPPVRGVELEVLKQSGVTTTYSEVDATYSSKLVGKAVAVPIVEGKPLRIKISSKILNVDKGKGERFRVNYKIWIQDIAAPLHSSANKKQFYNGTWPSIATPVYSVKKTDVSKDDFESGDYLNTTIETPDIPAGYNYLFVDVLVESREYNRYIDAYKKVIWQLDAFSYTDWKGVIICEQAITDVSGVDDEPIYEKTVKYKSNLPSPKDKNSEFPKIDYGIANGRKSDAFALLVYDGSGWVIAGNWSDSNISGFSGDIPYLFNRSVMNTYANFLPTIDGEYKENSVYEVHKTLNYDSLKWIFNGGTYDASNDIWSAEWVAIEPDFSFSITDNTELAIRPKNTEILTDKLKTAVDVLRNDLFNVKDKVIADIFLLSDGSPTTDPAADKDFVIKVKYDNATQTVSAALEARTAFVNDVFAGGFNCGNAETDYSNAVGLKLGRAE